MSTAKREVENLLKELPEDCSLEDIQYHLYVLQKLQHSFEEVEQKGSLSHEEVKERLKKWIID